MGTETRGFASMSKEKQRAIARKGGLAAQAKGVAHRWDSEEAREAGRKGGSAPHKRRTRVNEPPSLPPTEEVDGTA